VLAEVIDRANNQYDRWAEQVAQAGYCAHPIRLAGRVEQADPARRRRVPQPVAGHCRRQPLPGWTRLPA
jgi:hypothetical protein